jgi:xylulose-5-phosphate/fructose-6-phosphate phosphoketolase
VAEESTTTTPFDITVMKDLDPYYLVGDVIDRLPQLGARAAYAKETLGEKLIEHQQYISKHGDDLPEIRNWRWSGKG